MNVSHTNPQQIYRIGQNFYLTYAHTRVERGFFSCPFLPQTQENKQKMPRNGTFFFRAKPRLRATLVIFPSDRMSWQVPVLIRVAPRMGRMKSFSTSSRITFDNGLHCTERERACDTARSPGKGSRKRVANKVPRPK